jgi:membrane protease YdiL (CAAX protease family)
MALTLGNPNLPGNAQYVQRTGRILLLWLLPFFALGIADGLFLPALARHPLYFWTYDFFKFVVLPIVYLLCFYRCLRIRPGDYFFIGHKVDYRGWEWFGVTLLSAIILDVIYIVAYPLVLFAYSAALAVLLWLISPWFDLSALSMNYAAVFSYGMALPDDRLLRAIVAIFFAATAGVVEEIFFRGLLRQAIAATLGPHAVKTYIILSALIFGLAHWEQGPAGLIGATAFGLCAAWLYLKLGDLRPLILAHALIDLYIFW